MKNQIHFKLEPAQAERLAEALEEIVAFKFFMKESKDYSDFKELFKIINKQIHVQIQNFSKRTAVGNIH